MTPHESRLQFCMKFTRGLFSTKTLVYIHFSMFSTNGVNYLMLNTLSIASLSYEASFSVAANPKS